ncbi:hypothetical protein FRC10_006208 [Ceratobasidium sp. 414]|nr:hypothetical protein FRC10_006208 [Ceratobasidium sp. 414]
MEYLAMLNAWLAAEVHQGDNNLDVENHEKGQEDIEMGDGEDVGPEGKYLFHNADWQPLDEDPFASLALMVTIQQSHYPIQCLYMNNRESEARDLDKGPANGLDQDPPYEEPNPVAGRVELDSLNKYEMGDATLWAVYNRLFSN